MPVSWIEYKEHKILYIDYTGKIIDDDLISVLYEGIEILKNSEGDVLVLSNFTDTPVGSKFMEIVKPLGVEVINPKTKKSAILGVTGIKKILLKLYNTFSGDKIVPFDTKEEALEYLVDSSD